MIYAGTFAQINLRGVAYQLYHSGIINACPSCIIIIMHGRASEALAHQPEKQREFVKWVNTNEEINSAVGGSRPKPPGARE
jgi:hypothetical protein